MIIKTSNRMRKLFIIVASALMLVSCSEQFNAAYLLSSGAKLAQAATLSDEQIQAYVGQYVAQLDAKNNVLPETKSHFSSPTRELTMTFR